MDRRDPNQEQQEVKYTGANNSEFFDISTSASEIPVSGIESLEVGQARRDVDNSLSAEYSSITPEQKVMLYAIMLLSAQIAIARKYKLDSEITVSQEDADRLAL